MNRTRLMTCFFFVNINIDMTSSIDLERIDQIITFLNSLNIKSKRLDEVIHSRNLLIIQIFDESLTHSSENKITNYEKLEFFGDAVLRLAATNFIEQKFKSMNVGDRSELRSQIVSDEWLSKLGKKIKIEKLIKKGPKALGDKYSNDTIVAEATEAFIGALYKCFNSTKEVNIWLDKFWEKDADAFLKEPYKYNAKSALQEWCQRKGFDLPKYRIIEISTNHGDPNRFSCEIYINGSKEAYSVGKSHKKAEKKAATLLIEKFMKEGKI